MTRRARTGTKPRSDPAEAAIAEAGALIQRGQPGEALERLAEAARRAPRSLELQMTLGSLAQQLGRAEDARDAFAAAVAAAPDDAQAHYFLATAHEDLGALDDAVAAYRRAVELEPDTLEAWFNLAGVLADRGALGEAVGAFRRAAALGPEVPETHHGLGAALAREGAYDEAIEALERAVALKPDFADAHFALGNALRGLMRPDEAAERFRAAIAARAGFAEAHLNLAGCLQELGRFKEAESLLQKAIALNPGLAEAHYQSLRHRKVTEADRAELDRITALAERPGLPDGDRVNLHFALGKAHDDLADWDTAFAHFEAANRLKRAQTDYDPDALVAQFDAIAALVDRDFIAARDGLGDPDERPVFIVGMPRSGTTLVEQILASHPQVFGAGELPVIGRIAAALHRETGAGASYPAGLSELDRATARRLAARYLDRTRELDPDAARVTDKMPSNFIHLGLIALLLPAARIIHCVRDPVDTCLSCYVQNFTLPLRFSHDLAELGHYHVQYERLMAHWREALPEPPFQIGYEDLTAEPERLSRALVAFAGLDWDDRCLAPHETERAVGSASAWQVRQPIYRSSVKKWRHYERHLAPLLDALGPERATA